jgi:hypothetical protein
MKRGKAVRANDTRSPAYPFDGASLSQAFEGAGTRRGIGPKYERLPAFKSKSRIALSLVLRNLRDF